MAKSGTVLVNLRKDWFGPNGSLYQARDNPHEFPADWADKGELSDEDKKEAPPVKVEVAQPVKKEASRYAVLPSSAEIVESGATVMVRQNTGGGQQILVPSAVEDGAKSVGGAMGKDGTEEADQSVASAAAVAKTAGMDQVGGKPRESGPLPAGTKKPA